MTLLIIIDTDYYAIDIAIIDFDYAIIDAITDIDITPHCHYAIITPLPLRH
jgi:hypothetical protein